MKIIKDESEWRKELSAQAYHVLFENGTEPAFYNEYHDLEADGEYHCRACGELLFDSKQKYHSGTGWPSFYDAADKGAIETHRDHTFGMARTAVRCSTCGGHLGHLFKDGPKPTGKRYCVNSAALEFVPRED